jgi:hypothetical protein
VYGGLDEMKRFGIPNPNHFKARLLTSVLNPNDVARAHVSADTGQQSATSANAGGNDLLSEALTSLVSAVYRYDEAVIFPKLTALFHGFSKALPELNAVDSYAKNRQRVGLQSPFSAGSIRSAPIDPPSRRKRILCSKLFTMFLFD